SARRSRRILATGRSGSTSARRAEARPVTQPSPACRSSTLGHPSSSSSVRSSRRRKGFGRSGGTRDMRAIWKSRDTLERRLRDGRPTPRQQVVDSISALVSSRPTPRSAKLRLGLAGAFSAVFVVSLAAFGGLGYAATAVSHVANSAAHFVSPPQHDP